MEDITLVDIFSQLEHLNANFEILLYFVITLLVIYFCYKLLRLFF